MPIININQPKPFFRLSPDTFFAIIPPTKLPAMAIAVTFARKIQFIVKCPKSPVNPVKEFKAMMNRDVPTASFIGSFTSNTKVGIKRKPPPAPKRPVAMPIAVP